MALTRAPPAIRLGDNAQHIMGLFDSIAKQALGGLLGGGKNTDGLDLGTLMSLLANQGKVSEAVTGLLGETGGLSGLLGKFQSSGLGDAVSSWVGAGDNQAVDNEQVRSALGGEAVEHFAGKLGLRSEQILPVLAQFLPVIIDKLTPGGAVDDNEPSADKLQQVLAQVAQSVIGGKA